MFHMYNRGGECLGEQKPGESECRGKRGGIVEDDIRSVSLDVLAQGENVVPSAAVGEVNEADVCP